VDAMTEKTAFDIVIAGGGMVGASLAIALARALPALKIAIVDRFPSRVDQATQTHTIRQASTSFDGRSTVLSEGSRRIFAELNLWSALESHSTAITNIHVSERGSFGTAHLSAQEHGWSAMGFVVDNAQLGKILLNALHDYKNIQLINPATVTQLRLLATGCELTLEMQASAEPQLTQEQQKKIHTALAIVADGADSQLRQSLGIGATQYDYQQYGLIANVSFSKAHNGCAYERFTDWGPMALLPLAASSTADQQQLHRAALIWTMDANRIEQLKNCSEQEFLSVLQQRFGYRQGRFLKVGQRHTYPLVLNSAAEQVRQHIVILGNAAHTLHPVAGQGFNLSLRDVASLARVLLEANNNNEALGDIAVLQRYMQRRQTDQNNTIEFSHRLNQLFSNQYSIVKHGRSLGLLALDGLPILKSVFTDYSAGTAAWERL
jgi:2-octaprenyl-6-methoxyphenol hydroxylase